MRLPEWIQRYVSIPYEERNCWELVQAIYAAEFGLDIGEKDQWPQQVKDKAWFEVTTPREGDVVLFKTTENAKHVGIVLGVNGYMIHTQRGSNSCIEAFTTRLWKNRVLGFYRHVNK